MDVRLALLLDLLEGALELVGGDAGALRVGLHALAVLPLDGEEVLLHVLRGLWDRQIQQRLLEEVHEHLISAGLLDELPALVVDLLKGLPRVAGEDRGDARTCGLLLFPAQAGDEPLDALLELLKLRVVAVPRRYPLLIRVGV